MDQDQAALHGSVPVAHPGSPCGNAAQQAGSRTKDAEGKVHSRQVDAPMSSTDRDALVTLFERTDGGSWKDTQGWNTSADLSTWHGVKVNEEGRVVHLWLIGNGLRGPVPAELGSLSKLERLWLSDNQLSGLIPTELGNLKDLLKLSLSGNSLSGFIPQEMGSLTNLAWLNLSGNELTGPIPESIGLLSSMQYLSLEENQLSGYIPPQLGDLGSLVSLRLGGNQLSGMIPKEFERFPAQTHLSLERNHLTEIPMAVINIVRAPMGESFVNLSGNPWKKPPLEVVERGPEAMLKYLQDLDTFGSARSNRLKVVLVGLGNAGKTSIAIRLEKGTAADLPRSEERTVGVEIRDIELGPNPTPQTNEAGLNLAVKLWDFAGQRAYYDTHQMFLTRGALFVLVVDMFAYSVENRREEALEQWLDILQSRVPGAIVLLVGTHRDEFGDDTDSLRGRVQCFNADVTAIIERMREDCEGRKGQYAKEGDQERFRPLRVVEETLVMSCTCSNEEELEAEIKRLRVQIEKVAYERGYPTVDREVPAPYAHAVATLEAVRRGADLAGAGGDHEKVVRQLGERDPGRARAYIRFSDALSRFMQLWPEQKIRLLLYTFLIRFNQVSAQELRPPPDAAQLFWRAIELHEAEGSVLLTYADGSVVWRQDDSVTKDDIVIHVSPVRFADLVRRIVDVRLLEPERMADMELQLEKFALAKGKDVTVQELSRQQNKFYAAGEVSRNFLEFLWVRDLRLGPTSMFSPPLELGEHDLEVMVHALVELRMMFPVRDEARLYVVGSCLPEHVSHEEDPIEMLELGVGSAMFSQRLDIIGAHTVPPGLIPRLLAWVGAKSGRFHACWKHGCCFAFGNYLTLVYVCRNDVGRPSVMCCVKGDANNEKAGEMLESIASEIGDLVRHEKYGFPGLDLRERSIKKQNVTGQDELETLLEMQRERLEDHMSVRFDVLERKSERIAGRVYFSTRENLTKLDRLTTSVEAVGDGTAAVDSKLDAIAALVGKCLLVSAAQIETCPRLVWIEEDNPTEASSPPPSRFSHFRRKAWDKIRRKRKQAFAGTRFRIRFLCAHDLSLAKCGHDGRGYLVEMKEWQRWLQRCLPVLQITLWLLRVGVSVVVRADILPVDSLLEKLRELAGEEISAQIEGIDLSDLGDFGVGDGIANAIDDRVKVFGKAYATLQDFVEAEENKLVKTPGVSASMACTAAGGDPGRPVLPSHGAEKRSFEEDMALVHRVRDGSAEYAWVRKENIEAWQAAPVAAVAAHGWRQAAASNP